MNIEDRVRAATRARADLVRDICPLALPEDLLFSDDRPERARRTWSARQVRPWLVPLVVAGVVVALALTLVIVRQAAAPRRAPPPVAPTGFLAKIPRYYGVISSDRAFSIVDDRTGKKVVDFAAPGAGTLDSVSASADDKTFILTSRMLVNQDTTRWTVTKIRLFPHPGLVFNEADIAVQDTDNAVHLNAYLSPDGREVAVEFERLTGTTVTTTIQTYHATQSSPGPLRTWTTSLPGAAPIGDLSWHGNDQTLEFSTPDAAVTGDRPPAYNRERALTTTAPSGDLMAASRVIFSGPSSLHAVSCAALRITPDGQTAICGTRAGVDVSGARPSCTAGPSLVAYSVRGSQRERILYGFPPCDTGNVVPVWTDATGSTVVGLFPGTSVRSGRTVLGVLSGHKLYSLPLPVTPVDGTGDGNAIAFLPHGSGTAAISASSASTVAGTPTSGWRRASASTVSTGAEPIK